MSRPLPEGWLYLTDAEGNRVGMVSWEALAQTLRQRRWSLEFDELRTVKIDTELGAER